MSISQRVRGIEVAMFNAPWEHPAESSWWLTLSGSWAEMVAQQVSWCHFLSQFRCVSMSNCALSTACPASADIDCDPRCFAISLMLGWSNRAVDGISLLKRIQSCWINSVAESESTPASIIGVSRATFACPSNDAIADVIRVSATSSRMPLTRVDQNKYEMWGLGAEIFENLGQKGSNVWSAILPASTLSKVSLMRIFSWCRMKFAN